MSNQTNNTEHAEILAGFEQDLRDAIEATRAAEMNLRRCREREARCRSIVEERRDAIRQEVVNG